MTYDAGSWLANTRLFVADVLALTRIGFVPPLALPFLLGALCYAHLGALRAVGWGATGCALHAFSCALNDIVDRRSDQLDPRRGNRPLTSGRLGVRMAWCITATCAGIYVTGITYLRPPDGTDFLILSLALTVWCNLTQKRAIMSPILSDMLWALSVAVPLLAFSGPRDIRALLATALLTVMFVAFEVAGSDLKDLESDVRLGVPSSGIALGLRPVPGGAHAPRLFRRWLAGAYMLMGLVAIAGLAVAKASAGAWVPSVLLLAAGGLLLRRYTTAARLRRGATSVLFAIGPFASYLCILSAVGEPLMVVSSVAITLLLAAAMTGAISLLRWGVRWPGDAMSYGAP